MEKINYDAVMTQATELLGNTMPFLMTPYAPWALHMLRLIQHAMAECLRAVEAEQDALNAHRAEICDQMTGRMSGDRFDTLTVCQQAKEAVYALAVMNSVHREQNDFSVRLGLGAVIEEPVPTPTTNAPTLGCLQMFTDRFDGIAEGVTPDERRMLTVVLEEGDMVRVICSPMPELEMAGEGVIVYAPGVTSRWVEEFMQEFLREQRRVRALRFTGLQLVADTSTDAYNEYMFVKR